MALPTLLKKLFNNDGYGPQLNNEIVSRDISIQNWSNTYDYPTNVLVKGSDGLLYRSVAQSGPNTSAGAVDPTADDGTHWTSIPTNDGDVVHKSAGETITGPKTFQGWVNLDGGGAVHSTLYYATNNFIFNGVESHVCQITINRDTKNFGAYDITNDHWVWLARPTGANDFYGTVHSQSDRKFKSNISEYTDEFLDVWHNIEYNTFRLNVSTEKISSGVIAQNIINAFKENNIDVLDYNFIEYDENLQGYTICYTELLCIEAAYQRRRADRAEARISALEARLAALEAKFGV